MSSLKMLKLSAGIAYILYVPGDPFGQYHISADKLLRLNKRMCKYEWNIAIYFLSAAHVPKNRKVMWSSGKL